MQILPVIIEWKLEVGENCSHKGNFRAMKMRLVPKCSEEHSAVRSQGSGVKGQGSGVKAGVKYRNLGFFSFFLGLINLWPPFGPLTSDPQPLTPDCRMLFWAFWYEPHPHSSYIAFVRAILSHLKFSTDSCKTCISGSFIGKCYHKLNFWGMKMRLVPKCSKEHSPVRGQQSGVRGHNKGHKLM